MQELPQHDLRLNEPFPNFHSISGKSCVLKEAIFIIESPRKPGTCRKALTLGFLHVANG